MFSIYIVKPTL